MSGRRRTGCARARQREGVRLVKGGETVAVVLIDWVRFEEGAKLHRRSLGKVQRTRYVQAVEDATVAIDEDVRREGHSKVSIVIDAHSSCRVAKVGTHERAEAA